MKRKSDCEIMSSTKLRYTPLDRLLKNIFKEASLCHTCAATYVVKESASSHRTFRRSFHFTSDLTPHVQQQTTNATTNLTACTRAHPTHSTHIT